MIHADTREKPPLLDKLRAALPASEYVKHTLWAGDFVLFDQDGHSLGIEHKEPLDFLSSLGGRQANGKTRMANQVAKLLDHYTHSLIVVTGPLIYDTTTKKIGSRKRATNWGALAVRLLEWEIAKQVPILQLDGHDEFVAFLAHLNKRANSGCVIPGEGILSH